MTDVEVQPGRHAVLTEREKAEFRGQVFRDRSFDGFDFDDADLSFATFIDCSLYGAAFGTRIFVTPAFAAATFAGLCFTVRDSERIGSKDRRSGARRAYDGTIYAARVVMARTLRSTSPSRE